MDPKVAALLQLLGGIPNVTITQSGNSLIAANNPINTLTSANNPAPAAPFQARSAVRPQAAEVARASQHQASHTSGSQSQLSCASRSTGTATTPTQLSKSCPKLVSHHTVHDDMKD
uniref:Uncharacterized protein n=1 Tax=Amphimedon queenslandica TaxID=400682 RepID=A0A1X7UZN6_AMPQE